MELQVVIVVPSFIGHSLETDLLWQLLNINKITNVFPKCTHQEGTHHFSAITIYPKLALCHSFATMH